MYRGLVGLHLLAAVRVPAGTAEQARRAALNARSRHAACMPVAHDANAAYSDSPSDAKATPSALSRTLPSSYGLSGRAAQPAGRCARQAPWPPADDPGEPGQGPRRAADRPRHRRVPGPGGRAPRRSGCSVPAAARSRPWTARRCAGSRRWPPDSRRRRPRRRDSARGPRPQRRPLGRRVRRGQRWSGRSGRPGLDHAGPGAARRAGRGRAQAPSPRVAWLALAAVVIVAGGGYASYKYLYEPRVNAPVSSTLRLPTDAPGSPGFDPALGKWQHIGTRAQDPEPLTLDELFPPQFELNGSSYVRTAAAVTKNCSLAVFGADLQAALQAGHCTQVLRASYISGNGTMMGTVGVANLSSSSAAQKAGERHRAAGDHRAARGAEGPDQQARQRHRGGAGRDQGALPDLDVGRVHQPEVAVHVRPAAAARAVRDEPGHRQRQHRPQHPDADG